MLHVGFLAVSVVGLGALFALKSFEVSRGERMFEHVRYVLDRYTAFFVARARRGITKTQEALTPVRLVLTFFFAVQYAIALLMRGLEYVHAYIDSATRYVALRYGNRAPTQSSFLREVANHRNDIKKERPARRSAVDNSSEVV